MVARQGGKCYDRQGIWVPCGKSRSSQLDLVSGKTCERTWPPRWVLKEEQELFRQRPREVLQAEGTVCVKTYVLDWWIYSGNSREFGIWGWEEHRGKGVEVRLGGRQRPVIKSPVGYPRELGLDPATMGAFLQGAGKTWNLKEKKNVTMTFWGLKYIGVFVALASNCSTRNLG